MEKTNKSDIKSIIGSVLGAEDERDVDFTKSFSKYINMRDISQRYIALFNFLANSQCLKKFPKIAEDMADFVKFLNKMLEEMYSYDLSAIEPIYNKYPFVDAADNVEILHFTKAYNLVKKSELIQIILDTCNSLVSHKTNLADKDTLSDKFILRYAGNNLTIIPKINLNLKFVYLGSGDDDKKIFMLFLHKLYTISYSMYEEYGKPDINMDNFVRAIEMAIKDLRKKIPRCDQAFKIIEDSSKLLENNYPTYYKDYVSTNNSMIIAENFIQDVAGSVSGKSPKVAFQFKRIITELKRMATSAQSLDPKYKEMISVLSDTADTNFSNLEKEHAKENISMEESDEDEPSPDPEAGKDEHQDES